MQRSFHRSALVVAVIFALASASVATGALSFYDQNFDGLIPGSINGQDGWVGGSGDLVQSTVALSGNALLIDDATVYRPGIFPDITASPIVNISFDLRLSSDIGDFAGVPNTDMQGTILFRGPNTDQEFAFVYKVGTLSDGTIRIDQNGFEIRGTTIEHSVLDGVIPTKDIWYHVELEIDWNGSTIDGHVKAGGTSFWDPDPVIGFTVDGNTNVAIIVSGDDPNAPFYIDNFSVTPEPSRALLLLIGLGAVGLRRS
jgi:hypothetical protein